MIITVLIIIILMICLQWLIVRKQQTFWWEFASFPLAVITWILMENIRIKSLSNFVIEMPILMLALLVSVFLRWILSGKFKHNSYMISISLALVPIVVALLLGLFIPGLSE